MFIVMVRPTMPAQFTVPAKQNTSKLNIDLKILHTNNIYLILVIFYRGFIITRIF